MKQDKRTARLAIRLDDSEAATFREKAQSFSSLSSMIRTAVANMDDVAPKERKQRVEALTALYAQMQRELGKVGANLNQAMKRANELAIGNQLTETYIYNNILPYVHETYQLLMNLKEEQRRIVMDVLGYK